MFLITPQTYFSLRNGFGASGGGVTPIGDLVYMCLPGLWVSLRYFARVFGSCFVNLAQVMGLLYEELP